MGNDGVPKQIYYDYSKGVDVTEKNGWTRRAHVRPMGGNKTRHIQSVYMLVQCTTSKYDWSSANHFRTSFHRQKDNAILENESARLHRTERSSKRKVDIATK